MTALETCTLEQRAQYSLIMDKNSNKKSTLLTPCRSVGLKRKRDSSLFEVASPPTDERMKQNINHTNYCVSYTAVAATCSTATNSTVTSSTANVIKNLGKARPRSLGNALRRSLSQIPKCKTSNKETVKKSCTVDDSTDKLLSLCASTSEMSEAPKLKELTETWRSACQAALLDLLDELNTSEKETMTMKSLLNHLNIPVRLMHYDAERDDFY